MAKLELRVCNRITVEDGAQIYVRFERDRPSETASVAALRVDLATEERSKVA